MIEFILLLLGVAILVTGLALEFTIGVALIVLGILLIGTIFYFNSFFLDPLELLEKFEAKVKNLKREMR